MQNQNEIHQAISLMLDKADLLGVTVEFGDADNQAEEAYYIPSTRQIYVCARAVEQKLFSLAHELGHATDYIESGLLDVFWDIVLFPFPKRRYLHAEWKAWKLGGEWIPESVRSSYKEEEEKSMIWYKQASLKEVRSFSCLREEKVNEKEETAGAEQAH